jgi:quercetin dioxygenase-like cupin family protein
MVPRLRHLSELPLRRSALAFSDPGFHYHDGMGTRFVRPAGYVLALAVAFGLGTAVGRRAPPKDNQGLAVEKTVTLDLGGEIEGMQGRQLRMRLISVEPAGVIGLHSHKDRPAVTYVLQGALTEYRDGAMKDHPKGEILSAGKATTHWEENREKSPTVLVVADIFKP